MRRRRERGGGMKSQSKVEGATCVFEQDWKGACTNNVASDLGASLATATPLYPSVPAPHGHERHDVLIRPTATLFLLG